jgi:hypothetical protein
MLATWKKKKHRLGNTTPHIYTLFFEHNVFRPLQQSASPTAMARQGYCLRFDCRQHHDRGSAGMDSLAIGFLVLFGESGAEGWQVVCEDLGCEQYGVLRGYAVCFLADYGCYTAIALAGCECLSKGRSGGIAMGKCIAGTSWMRIRVDLLTEM